MAAYVSSADALRKLLTCRGVFGSCRITNNIPSDIRHATDGIEYCAVEVTCEDSIQYGIQAYGEEAIELHKEALRLSGKKQIERKEEGIPLLYNAS